MRIQPRWTFPEVRTAALAVAREMERRLPGVATTVTWPTWAATRSSTSSWRSSFHQRAVATPGELSRTLSLPA